MFNKTPNNQREKVMNTENTDYSKNVEIDHDQNRDPISGEPGSHPIGTGVGAAGTGTLGALTGAALGGPVGAVLGAAAGASLGGLAGHTVGEKVNPTFGQIEPVLQSDFASRPYAAGSTFDEYRPAYEYGNLSYGKYGRNFDGTRREWDDKFEADLRRDWEQTKASANATFDKAKDAIRDGWHATERAIPGDFDKDGR